MTATAATTLPSGPTAHPLRSIVRWLRSPLPMLDELAARHGNAFTVRVPRQPDPMVFFADPAAVRDLWTGDPEVFRAGEANVILRSVLGPASLLVLDGARHLRERRLMLPPFHGDRMRAYGIAMRDAALREVARWPVGTAFPAHTPMQAITLDVIMRTVFGVDDEEGLATLRDALVRWTTLGTSRLGTAILLLTPPELAEHMDRAAKHPLGRFLPWAPITRAHADVDRVVRDVITARRRRPRPSADVLSMLIAARDEQGAPMTDDELRDEMLTLLVAGHETTATTLAWALHHLLTHPTWLARIRAEIDEVTGGAPIDPSHLDKLVLTDAAIKETLRLTPIVPIVARRLARAATVGGYALPAGTIAAACIYLVHRRADLWPDPTRFDPDRFVGTRPDPTHYFPFGGGTRRCLGAAFATYEMKLVLASILSRVDLAAAPGPPIRLVRRGITIAPSGGMPIVVTRRRS